MNIFLGADHAGTHLKEVIKSTLRDDGHDVHDVSPASPEGGDDYPDYAFSVANAVAQDAAARGILVCDTGIGMAIAANKVRGAHAALVVDSFGAKRAREHNDANILVFGAEHTRAREAIEATRVFLRTPHTHAERHARRLGKIRYFEEHGIIADAGE